MAPSLRVVALLLFGSGFAALVYQTAWQRMFRLSFGASTAASAAVLAIFLGGLGLGGALLGKRVERSTRPLSYYGNLELGITLLAALSPLLGAATHSLYLSLGGSQAMGLFTATLLRLLLAALVIGPAAVLMGGTLPAAARAVVGDGDANRGSLALLYSLNTVGAVVGALVGPLLLFGLLGNQLTLWGAACINAIVGLTARALGRRVAEVPVTSATSTSSESDAPASGPAPAPARLIYATAALVGFAFLALELVWYRVLAPLLGGSSLTFGLILACALAGIGIGGYWFSRRAASKPATLELLALTLSLEAVCVLLPFVWGDDLALVAAHLRDMANLGFGYLLAVWTSIAAVLVLPAAIVSGYQFPVLFSLLGRGRSEVARQVGRAYAFNTIGTLSGSLLVGFALLPSLGAVTLWRLLGQSLALFGVVCAVLAFRSGAGRQRVFAPLVIALGALTLSLARGPGGMFRHTPVGAGRVMISTSSINQVIDYRRKADRRLLWQRDGVESSVAIAGDHGLSFLVNGKSDGSVIGDRGTQAFLGLLPAALQGNVKSAFVIGLGTGMTGGLLANVPGVARVDVAELEPAVREMARRSASVNDNALDNPKVHILEGDGRELLLTSKRTYDLIVSEPSNPYRAGIASLYTQEFYAAAASRLSKRGLFAQWTQGYEIDAGAVATVLKTLRTAFPYVSVWGPAGEDLILIGSFEPQRANVEQLRSFIATPHYQRWLRRAWATESVEGFLAHHLAGPKQTAQLAQSLPSAVNSDDVNVLEFAFGRTLGDHSYSLVRDLFRTLPVTETLPEVQGEIDWKKLADLRYRIGWDGYKASEPSDKTRAVTENCQANVRGAVQAWPEAGEPEDVVEAWTAGWVRAYQGKDSALAAAEYLQRDGFAAEAMLVRMRLFEHRKEYDAQLEQLLGALAELRKTPLPLCEATGRALRAVQPLAARLPQRAPELMRAVSKGPFAVYIDEFSRQNDAAQLAIAMPTPELCIEALGSYRSDPAWTLGGLSSRAFCLEKAKAADGAAALNDLDAYMANEPVSFRQAKSQKVAAEAASDPGGGEEQRRQQQERLERVGNER